MKSLGKVQELTRNEPPRLRSGKNSLAFFLGAFLAAQLIGLLAMGCKKEPPVPKVKETDRQSSPVEAAPSANDGRLSNAPVAVVISDSSDINATLHQLSLELRRYVVRTHSVPKNFEEFAAKSQAQIPPAPAGKKYAIQGQVVVLVTR